MMNFVQEETAEFVGGPKYAGPKRFRRFGDLGPAYTILADHGSTYSVLVIGTGEVFDYERERADADPEAVSVP